MKLRKCKVLAIFFAFILVACIGSNYVNAEEPTTGSLTIITHEQQNEDTTTNPPLEGIEYTVYKVDETCEDRVDGEYYIEENNIQGISKTTDSTGTVVFDNLELGRYYVKVTDDMDGVLSYENFLVDIPMTNAQGTGLDYNITVEPKIQTAYGNFELIKTDLAGKPLSGVTFKVQVMKRSSAFSLDDLPLSVWTDYIPEGEDSVLTVTTNSEGKITLSNLPAYFNYGGAYEEDVIYRLIEISTPERYINNNIISDLFFYVGEDGKVYTNYQSLEQFKKYFITNVVEGDNLTSVTYMNEKPEIIKKVKNSAGDFVDSASAFMSDKVTFSITVDVPMSVLNMSTYKITDNIPTGLVLDRDSIVVEGMTPTGKWVIPEELYTLSDTGLEITFNASDLNGLSAIVVTYDISFDSNNVVIGGDGNINTATLEYTNNISEDGVELSTTTITDSAEVHTGAVSIEKIEKGNVDNRLPGAKFKIATTEENAKNGVFVKNSTGEDIEVETDAQGQAIIEGLAYADNGTDVSYWLVETQAPSYQEDGETKYYNILKSPVEVRVGKTTHTLPIQIQNSKGLTLPATGGIGIAIFAIAGIAIMGGAIVLNKKQKANEQ